MRLGEGTAEGRFELLQSYLECVGRGKYRHASVCPRLERYLKPGERRMCVVLLSLTLANSSCV
jgi:hypothetical protein